MKKKSCAPTPRQINVVREVVRWYLNLYHLTDDDPGVLAMFADSQKVGAFAIDPRKLGSDGDALFRLLVATTMFQRRQDVQILRVLRGIAGQDVDELARPRRLLELVDQTPCPHVRTTEALHARCDLAKHAVTRKGRCSANPKVACHLKRHTVLLRRYGHFGKVPTSSALVLREAGVESLRALRTKVLRKTSCPNERARLLEEHLSRGWRVSSKIAAMFLSALSAPDISVVKPPWRNGIDWTHFVVVDSNVDLFLRTLRYRGPWSYEARREFVRALAAKIDLKELSSSAVSFNPRLVQQAMYIFMSTTNRRALRRDCMHRGPATCSKCPRMIAELCPVKQRAKVTTSRARGRHRESC